MLTVEHWAVLGQTFVLFFCILGIVVVGYVLAREVSK